MTCPFQGLIILTAFDNCTNTNITAPTTNSLIVDISVIVIKVNFAITLRKKLIYPATDKMLRNKANKLKKRNIVPGHTHKTQKRNKQTKKSLSSAHQKLQLMSVSEVVSCFN